MKDRHVVGCLCVWNRIAVAVRCVPCCVLWRRCVADLVRDREHVLAKNYLVRFVSLRLLSFFQHVFKVVTVRSFYLSHREHWLRRDYVCCGWSVNCERTPARPCAFWPVKGRRGMNSNCTSANRRNNSFFFVKVRILTICGRGEGCPTASHAAWLEDKLRCVGHVQCVQFTIALSMFCFHMILLVILCLALFFWFLNVHVFHYFYSLYFCEEQCASPSTRAMLSVVVNCFVMSSCSENCDVYWCFRSRSLRPCSMKVRRFVSRVCACSRFAVVSRCVSCWVLLRECVAVLVRQREHVLENSEFLLFVSFRFVASFCRSSKKCSWWKQYVRFTCRKEHWLRREYVWWGRSVNCERTPANECVFATRVFHRERWSMAPHAEIVVAVPRQCVVTWGQRLWTRSRLPNGNKYSTAKGQELCATLDILRVGPFTRRCIHSRLMSFSRYVVLTVRMMVTTTDAPNQHVVSYLRFAFFRTKLLFHFLHSSVLPLRGHRRCRWCSTSLPRVAGELIQKSRLTWSSCCSVEVRCVNGRVRLECCGCIPFCLVVRDAECVFSVMSEWEHFFANNDLMLFRFVVSVCFLQCVDGADGKFVSAVTPRTDWGVITSCVTRESVATRHCT